MGNRWVGSTEPAPAEGRTCSTCKERKPLDQFGISSKATGKLRGQCNPCRTHIERERYLRNREEILARQRVTVQARRDAMGEEEYLRRRRAIQKRSRERSTFRTQVLEAYGSTCACCGETTEAFLQVDHVDNDGAQHRKMVPAVALYAWLCKADFPKNFQLLCANCNIAKHQRGCCPHQTPGSKRATTLGMREKSPLSSA